ncbi:MAG TPA: TIGR03560 family F420-dependent LLM class oxidoreductase [Actinomycetota bacterium]|nr:TIGR03560 family F420-dependent LLM class oxidoreductase [Actinomycetota bacterium]
MRFGLDVSQHQLAWSDIVARARFAEDADFDGIWVFDHFKALYADPKGPCLEGWTLLAALAAVTDRVRLGALVTGMTYRHPSVLAAEAVTVDHVSNGRLELGLGASWFQREHDELGIEFPATPERIERLDEGVQVMRLLMTSDDVSFDGHHYRLRNATYRPRPIQQPHPPIWIGASGEQLMLPLVGRLADAWHSFGSVEVLSRRWNIVREHAERAGRDPRSILRSSSLSLSEPWNEVRRTIETCAEAGIEYLVVSFPSEGHSHLERFVADVVPDFR